MGQKINAKEIATNREVFGAPDLEQSLTEIKKRFFVNVKDYIENFNADLTNDIQKAINKIEDNEGGVLYFPKGIYNISNYLHINFSNITILFDNNAEIKLNYNINIFENKQDYCFLFGDKDINHNNGDTYKQINNIKIINANINGGDNTYEAGHVRYLIKMNNVNDFLIKNCNLKSYAVGIVCYSCENGVIKNNKTEDFSVNHIRLHRGFPYGPNKNIFISNNKLIADNENASEGIHLDGLDVNEVFAEEIFISNNKFISSVGGGSAIDLDTANDCFINNNFIEGWSKGVGVFNGSKNIIINNNNIYNGNIGINLSNLDDGSPGSNNNNIKIINNHLENNNWNNILLSNTDDIEIKNNNFLSGSSSIVAGIDENRRVNNLFISNNFFKNNNSNVIYVNACDFLKINSNEIKTAFDKNGNRSGIKIDSLATNISILNNIIDDVKNIEINADNCNINNNKFTNLLEGFLIKSNFNNINNNYLTSKIRIFENYSNNTLQNNFINTVLEYGLLIEGNDNLISNNTIKANTNGIWVRTGTNNDLIYNKLINCNYLNESVNNIVKY